MPLLPSNTLEPVTNVALACFDPEPESRSLLLNTNILPPALRQQTYQI